jgi:hypothetical protein
VILALLWGFLGWASLFVAIKAARSRRWFGALVGVCLGVLFAAACADELVVGLLITAVEAAGR